MRSDATASPVLRCVFSLAGVRYDLTVHEKSLPSVVALHAALFRPRSARPLPQHAPPRPSVTVQQKNPMAKTHPSVTADRLIELAKSEMLRVRSVRRTSRFRSRRSTNDGSWNMSQPSVEQTVNEAVDIIASGYEWICPKCQSYNSLIAWQPSVTCRNPQCAESYPTNCPEHCLD
jgi:hypothetical protein